MLNHEFNCINIEIWRVIRDLIEEIQNQEQNWKKCVNWGWNWLNQRPNKKIKVYWSIEGQNAQIQNQGLK